jgi:hypothetical protein
LCPNASADAHREAQAILMEKGIITILEAVLPICDNSITTTGDSSESTKFVVLKKRKTGGTLDHYIDHLLTPQQKADADMMFFRLVISLILSHKCLLDFNRFLVHGNVAFCVAENVFLSAWLNKIRPSYVPPSRYVLSHTIMDAEAAQTQVEEVERLKLQKQLTLLFDGWEDKLWRSLYRKVVAELGTPPTVLSLDELTGH